jgi:hypothetical protein
MRSPAAGLRRNVGLSLTLRGGGNRSRGLTLAAALIGLNGVLLVGMMT